MSNYPEADKQLQELAKGGDVAWHRFYDDHRSPFRLYFLKMGQRPEAVIELYQEANVILHRKVTTGQLAPPMSSELLTYLIGVGRMLARRQGSSLDWDEEIPEVAVGPEVEQAHERSAQADLVRQLLNKLGGTCQKILEMVYLKGYVMEAVAQELELPSAGAARRRKHDCLKRVRALVE